MNKEMHIEIFEGTNPEEGFTELISHEQLTFLLSKEYAQARVNFEENFDKILPEMKKGQYAIAKTYINRARKYNDFIKTKLPSLDRTAMLNELGRTLEEHWK